MASFFTSSMKHTSTSEDLIKIRAGSAWIYTDSWETYNEVTSDHMRIIVRILEESPIFQFSYLRNLLRKNQHFKDYDSKYYAYIVNLTCANGYIEKLYCRNLKEYTYKAFFAKCQINTIQTVYKDIFNKLSNEEVLQIKQLAKDHFDGVKASYFWIKMLLEHLVYLNLARHKNQSEIMR